MDKKVLEEKTLIVGFDDSNHAGDRKGDILVASFSFNHEDSLIQKFKNRKDRTIVSEWFDEDKSRDYRFATLSDRILRNMQPNLQLVAPYLIEDFLKSYRGKIKGIKTYFDGIMNSWHKKFLREHFLEKFEFFSVDNFIKKGNLHNCPKTIYISHVLAHDLYEESFQEIINHEKRVEIPDGNEILRIFTNYKNECTRVS